MKRVLSLVLALVLVLGMMPTFAAGETGADSLYENGFISGANGDLMVDKSLTRAEMAVVLSELFGVKEAAASYAVPANFSDVNDHWAKSYIAYGQAAGWFGGYPDGTYKPEGVVSGNELAAFVLNALGYQGDYDFAEAIDYAATMGIEVPASTELTRGEAFESVWSTVNTPVKGSDVALGVSLGKIEPPVVAPTDLEVVSVKANNLVQVEVVFNQPVDEDTAEDTDNYDWDDNDTQDVIDAALQEDGETVILTLGTGTTITAMGQQDKDTLTISNVLTEDESVEIDDTDVDVTWLDQDLPTIEDVEVVGVSTIKVTFSEPMDPANVDKGSFEAKDGKYYIKDVTGQKNNTEWLVELYTSLTTGELPFEVKTDAKDYAGFTVIGKSFTLDVVEDSTAPTVVGYTDADLNGITLIWSEDVELVDGTAGNYYHTNSNNPVNGPVVAADIDGNELTMDFTTNELPEGTAYVYVLEDSVRDLWKNKNDQQMIKVEVTVDTTAPKLDDVDVDEEDTLILTFSEDIDKNSIDKSDFTVLDSDGDEISTKLSSAKLTDTDEITLIFADDLDGGDYTLVIEDLEDLAENEIEATSVGFTVTDLTAPVITGITAQFYQTNVGTVAAPIYDYVVRVNFPESMATDGEYSIEDMTKYVITSGGKDYIVDDISDAEIDVVSDGKAVEITFNSKDAKFALSTADADKIEVARVADEAGNYSAALSSGAKTLKYSNGDTVKITSVELTDVDTIEVSFDQELTTFEAADIMFFASAASTTAIDPESIDTDLDDDGFTVATYVFPDEFASDATNAYYRTAAGTATEPLESTNDYGNYIKLYGASAANLKVVDSCAPALAILAGTDEDDDVQLTTGMAYNYTTGVMSANANTDVIVMTFTETLDSSYIAKGMFDVSGFDADEITSVGLDPTSKKIVIVLDSSDGNASEGTTISLNGSISDNVDSIATKPDGSALSDSTDLITTLETEVYKYTNE
ncbi:Ig-like domain-containing protein [Fusibacter paucivorans]|uniref:Ig-like domain-containing protein n=1 Tax=Fusibacter paucivorans TaxID=76009 RepID=A0ABS5PN56_9FIRM|nr:Ig-like domain-containing protein [Fusibacter paucivorans]MBS7526595.1 Ig-like domain-containing protein [Fusibacter paucivorans]